MPSFLLVLGGSLRFLASCGNDPKNRRRNLTKILKKHEKVFPGGFLGTASGLLSKRVDFEVPPDPVFDAPVYAGAPFPLFPPGPKKVQKIQRKVSLLDTFWASWEPKG